jgi:phospho-N-acetylmuramoyl-pentapeptide-transferase
MLYALANFSDQIGPLNVFRFITFRTGGAIMTALLFVLLATHFSKQGAPTRVGLMILSGVTVAALVWAGWWNVYVWSALAILWMMGSSTAMNAIGKLDGQVVIPAILTAAIFGLVAFLSGNANFARYLQILHVPGVGELTVVCGAIVGAGYGCLSKERDGCSMRW